MPRPPSRRSCQDIDIVPLKIFPPSHAKNTGSNIREATRHDSVVGLAHFVISFADSLYEYSVTII